MEYLIYGMSTSGNCHKLKMALDILKQPYEWRETDTTKDETRTPEFLKLNPTGQVPLLVVDGSTTLSQSDAILWYLCEETMLAPVGKLDRALVLQWMFFEQYEHEPSIAVARYIRAFMKQPEHPRLPDLEKRGYDALAVMEQHLTENEYFVGKRVSIADLALYAYTHKADEGGFDLAGWPAIRAWLKRVAATPGVTPMPSP